MVPRSLTAECRLVFRSANTQPDLDEVRSLAAEVRDWERVCMLAEAEVATAALRRMLLRSGASVPPVASDYLARSAMVSDFRMRHVASRTQRTIAMLRERGIGVMLLKGAALGAMRDPTFCDRPMTDVDLLVRRDDLARARAGVIASGWPETTDPVLLELLKEHNHLPHFIDPQMPGVRLELHWGILPPDHSFAFTERALWRDARRAPAPYAGAALPSPEHLVLHAAIHYAWQHSMRFGTWRTIRLVSGVLNDASTTWERLVQVAEDARAGTTLHWTLRLASRLGGVTVPRAVLDRLSPPNPEPLMEILERQFIAAVVAGEGMPSPSQRVTRLMWLMALRLRWSGHRAAGRDASDEEWARARGTLSSETRSRRYARHLAHYRAWWNFLSRTLLP